MSFLVRKEEKNRAINKLESTCALTFSINTLHTGFRGRKDFLMNEVKDSYYQIWTSNSGDERPKGFQSISTDGAPNGVIRGEGGGG